MDKTYESHGGAGTVGSTKSCAGSEEVYLCHEVFSIEGLVTGNQYAAHKFSTSRSTETSYDFSVSFASDISTSVDPYAPGHPSDV